MLKFFFYYITLLHKIVFATENSAFANYSKQQQTFKFLPTPLKSILKFMKKLQLIKNRSGLNYLF